MSARTENKINILLQCETTFENNFKLKLSNEERAKLEFDITDELLPYVNMCDHGHEHMLPLIKATKYGYITMIKKLLPLTIITAIIKEQIILCIFNYYYDNTDNVLSVHRLTMSTHTDSKKSHNIISKIIKIYSNSADISGDIFGDIFNQRYILNITYFTPFMFLINNTYFYILKFINDRWLDYYTRYLINYKIAKLFIKNISTINLNYKICDYDLYIIFGHKFDLNQIICYLNTPRENLENFKNIVPLVNYIRLYKIKYKYLYLGKFIL